MSGDIRVLQVVDSLAAGGTERMAVRLANALAGRTRLSALCATRTGGPLESQIGIDVRFEQLGRRRALDPSAVRRFRELVADMHINVVHAHATSVYFCAAALAPRRGTPVLVAHDHNSRLAERHRVLARAAGTLSDETFAVSESIADWNRQSGVPARKVLLAANFADVPAGPRTAPPLPGQEGSRVVALANLRPEKNHIRLIRSFRRVVDAVPSAHLILVGSEADADHVRLVRSTVRDQALADHVTLMGVRSDVADVLSCCDVAVLPSLAEGCPLALLEYGLAGLASVATPVGQVPEVTDQGAAALLIDPLDEITMGTAIVDLLVDQQRRAELGARLESVVRRRYSADAVVPAILDAYRRLLSRSDRSGAHG